MRIIGSLENQSEAKHFSAFLRSKNIENTCEISFDKEKNCMQNAIWIHDEDQVNEAKAFLEAYQKNPQDPQFEASKEFERKPFSAIENPHQLKIDEKPQKKRFFMGVTYFFLGVCILVFMINAMQQFSMQKKEANRIVLFTPIQFLLLYDVPVFLQKLDVVLEKYQISPNTNPKDLPNEVKVELNKVENMPVLSRLLSDVFIDDFEQSSAKTYGEMFVQIREGQVWRLFTPAILHKDLLHILFNMLWLWVLGKQMEMRVPRFRYFLFIILVGIITNTAQYLVSGPYFLGFSGIIMGMAGFIWMRQRIAPWEGYPLNKSTLLFLAFFVIAMVGLQFVSLFMQVIGKEFAFNIANTAHVSGALFGALLGRIPFFAWRPT